MSASVRAATAADLDAVAALEQSCLKEDAWPRSLLEQGLSGSVPTVNYLVAGDPVRGYAVVSVAGDIAELQRIAVDPDARRAGIARGLFEGVLEIARAGHAARLLLEVRTDNAEALAFYAAIGFVELARRTRYYRDGATAVVMQVEC